MQCFFYKLISKILANRFRNILPLIIDEAQSAFVPRRGITDNVLLAFGILHAIRHNKSSKSGVLALKLDMSKAYDRVEWGFLDSIMERLEPCAKWRGWINECINSVSYQILINGKASNWFYASKGIRQGDPLSRYLFLLCTGGFNALLRKAVSDGYINGIQVCRCSPPVSHLFFADDYLLFIKRGLTAINNLQAILASFEKVSG